MRRSGPPDVRTYFDQESTRYVDERYRGAGCDQLSYRNRRRLALEMLSQEGGWVIDIGSGPGVLAAVLRERGFTPVELDVSLEMLRESRRRTVEQIGSGRVAYLQGRLPHLPFADGTFKAVMCIGVFAYLEDPDRSLREIRRVLRQDGVAIIQLSRTLCPTSRLHSGLRRAYRRMGEALGGRAYPHLRIPLASFRLREFERMLARERLALEEVAHYDFRPPLLEWVAPAAALRITRWLQRFERTGGLEILAEGMILRARAR